MYIKLDQILSVDTKNFDGGRGSALDPAGGAHDAPPDPLVRPKRLAPSALVPDFSDQIMVTLPFPGSVVSVCDGNLFFVSFLSCSKNTP